jgi:hypothetical protein
MIGPLPSPRVFVVTCLVLALFGSNILARSNSNAAATAGQRRYVYGGATVAGGAGHPATHIPSYVLTYPAGWSAQQWPDTLAGYGQVTLWSPAGGTIELEVLPVQGRGPTLSNLIAHDLAYLSRATRVSLRLPLGSATRIAGIMQEDGQPGQFVYVQRGAVVYRFFGTRMYITNSLALTQIAASLHVPAVPGERSSAPPAPSPAAGGCCHCPAWGTGWGTVLTYFDGVPVYWNAGNVNNGCDAAYGINYQCVELVQRYFAVRWGYPAIWRGVEGAADMRTNHPAGVQFVPNGGTPGPQRGDALLFYGGAFGHVALVKQVNRDGTLDLVEENWSPTGEAKLAIYAGNVVSIRDSTIGSYTVAGWLHNSSR